MKFVKKTASSHSYTPSVLKKLKKGNVVAQWFSPLGDTRLKMQWF
jgi:hypothetical protein